VNLQYFDAMMITPKKKLNVSQSQLELLNLDDWQIKLPAKVRGGESPKNLAVLASGGFGSPLHKELSVLPST
jgi:hypothetical protein